MTSGTGRALRPRWSAGALASVAMGVILVSAACGSPSLPGVAGDDASPGGGDAVPWTPGTPLGPDAWQETDDGAALDGGPRDADAASNEPDATLPMDSATDVADGDAHDAPYDAPADVAPDALTDAPPDTADSAPSVCGDGVRDPTTEECDNGTGNVDGTGACNTLCQVQDFLASSTISSTDAGLLLPFQYPAHTLGQGRHPIASGPGGFAVAFLEQGGNGDYTLRAEAFDPGGVRVASFPIIGTPGPALANADPVLAAISKTQYVALWGDTGDGQTGPGIAMAPRRTVGWELARGCVGRCVGCEPRHQNTDV
jgi:hypothetical protein